MVERGLRRGRLHRSRFQQLLQVLGAAAVVALMWFGAPLVLRRLDFFRVRRVEIAGLHYLAPARIIAALELDARASVFDDFQDATRGLRALSGVRKAVVKRRLPGTLEVVVEEAVPVALAPRGGGMALLDSSGQVLPFDPAASAPDLPIAASADRNVARVLAAIQAHEPELFRRVQAAWRVREDVVLDLDGRRLWFSPAATAEDIRAVMAVAQDLARQRREYGELDGRFAGQVIVRRPGT